MSTDDASGNPDSQPPDPDTNAPLTRSTPLIEDTLDELFELYQEHYTDHDDLEPREAFAKDMADRGVVFPEPGPSFGNGDQGSGDHGVLTGGGGGVITTTSNNAIDYNCGLLEGGLDRIHGWNLTGFGKRNLVLRSLDTEDVGKRLQTEAPDGADEFVKALLEHYKCTDDDGSGNDLIQGLYNLFDSPERLAWALEALTLDDRSVVEVAAVLGGGTGSALTVLVDELARIGLVGQGDVSVGYTLGAQQGRATNDIYLGRFDDGAQRYTWHDVVAVAERVGQRLRDGDSQWALWSQNNPLTQAFWALTNDPAFDHQREFLLPVRAQATPADFERAVDAEPRFNGIGHTERDRIKALGEFAFRQLIRRPSSTQFWVGEADYDPADSETDFHGLAWSHGFDAIYDFAELEDRNIPGIDGVEGHREALRALGYTASLRLTSYVSHDEIERANAVVHAADITLSEDDLELVEEAVTNVLTLGRDADHDAHVKAISMTGLGTDNYPGGYPLSVTVYAGHDLPLAAHEEMLTPEYRKTVTGGDT